MKNIGRNYILLGLIWLIGGMIFGMWLGATNQLNYANSHAHANLLGFVTSVLFGMIHNSYPALAKSRLALAQLVIYQAGTLILVIGKVLIDGGQETPLLIIGSLIAVLGAALMLVMFVKHYSD